MSKSWRGPSQEWRNRISSWEGSSMYKPAPDTGKVNNSFEKEAQGFINSLPISVRGALSDEALNALYSYSYNVGVGNFRKRVLPTLQAYVSGKASAQDVASHMYGTNDSKYKGLQNRRSYEREAFLRGTGNAVNNQSYKGYNKYTPTASPFTSTLGKLSAFSPKNSDGYTLPKVGNDANSYWYSYTAMPELKETREDSPTVVEYAPMFSTNTNVNTGSDYLNTIYKEQLEKMQDNVNQDLNTYVQQQDALDRFNAQMASLETPSQGNNIFAYGGEMDYRGEDDKVPISQNLAQEILSAYTPVEESDKSDAMLSIAKNISDIVKNEYNPEVLQSKEPQKIDDIPVSVSDTIQKKNKVVKPSKPAAVNTPKPTKLIVGPRANTLNKEVADIYEKKLGRPIERADDGSVQAVMTEDGEILGTAPALQLHEAEVSIMPYKDLKALVEAASKDDNAAVRLNTYLAEHAGNIGDDMLAPDGILGKHGITREKLNTLQMYYDDPYLRHSASGNFYFNPNAGTLRSIMRSERLAEQGLLNFVRGARGGLGVVTGGTSEMLLGGLGYGGTYLLSKFATDKGSTANKIFNGLNTMFSATDPVGAVGAKASGLLSKADLDKDSYIGNALASGIAGASYMKGPWYARAAVGLASALGAAGMQYFEQEQDNPLAGTAIAALLPAIAMVATNSKVMTPATSVREVSKTAAPAKAALNYASGVGGNVLMDTGLRFGVDKLADSLGLEGAEKMGFVNATIGAVSTSPYVVSKAHRYAATGLKTWSPVSEGINNVYISSGGMGSPLVVKRLRQDPEAHKWIYNGTADSGKNWSSKTKISETYSVPENFVYKDHEGNDVRVAGRKELDQQAKQINNTREDLTFDTTAPLWDLQTGKIQIKSGQTIHYKDADVTQYTPQPGELFSDRGTVLLVKPKTVKNKDVATTTIGIDPKPQDTNTVKSNLIAQGYTEASTNVMGVRNVDRAVTKGTYTKVDPATGNTSTGHVDFNAQGSLAQVSRYKHPTDSSQDVLVISRRDLMQPGADRPVYAQGNSAGETASAAQALKVNNQAEFVERYVPKAEKGKTEKKSYTRDEVDAIIAQMEQDVSGEVTVYRTRLDMLRAKGPNRLKHKKQMTKGIDFDFKEVGKKELIDGKEVETFTKTQVQNYLKKVQKGIKANIETEVAPNFSGNLSLNRLARKTGNALGHRVVLDLGSTSFTKKDVVAKLKQLKTQEASITKGEGKFALDIQSQEFLSTLYAKQENGEGNYNLVKNPDTGVVSLKEGAPKKITMSKEEALSLGAELDKGAADDLNLVRTLIAFAES